MTQQLFGMKIIGARKQMGLDQEALAKAIGTSQWSISVWENGKKEIPADKKKAICDFLGIEDTFATTKQEQAPKTAGFAQNSENQQQAGTRREQTIAEIRSLDNFRFHMIEQYLKFLKDGEN